MKRSYKYALLGATALALASAICYAAPYLVVRSLRQAVAQGDAAAVASHVDFPLLRESLKATMSAAMIKHTAGQEEGAGALAFGALLAGAFVDRMVDAMVTPEAVAMMMRGRKPIPNASSSDSGLPANVNTRMEYETLSTFVVTMAHAEESQDVSVVFTRDGLSWKLSAVRLPL
jgi:hypothetical protein